MTYAMCGRVGCRHHDGDGCTLETVDLVTSPVIGVPHCKDFEVVGDLRRAQPGADPIDLVKRELGELRRYKQELADARGSRDHWRKLADERESEMIMLKAERDACWVKLPVDAEGVPIHVGDELEVSGGEDGTCVSMERSRDGGWSVSVRPRGWDTPTVYDPLEVIHDKEQRTVEDVLSDFADDVIRCCDDREKLKAAAAEIRELLGVDDEE